MKHKSKQVLELEKALGFELEDNQFETHNNGDLKILYIPSNISKQKISIISELTSLENLSLTDNHIDDITFLSKLENLVVLILNRNDITDLTSLRMLKNLHWLHLSMNKIVDIETISELNNLTWLNLAYNEIKDIGSLEKLEKLNFLDLHNNLIEDVKPLRRLLKLEQVSLIGNRISDLTPLRYFAFHTNFSVDFGKGFSVGDNPLVIPPNEIIEQGNEAILSYFSELETKWIPYETERQSPLNEVRVIFLGQGQTGKTTLKKQLLGLPIPEVETQTDGIDIDVWQPEELDGIKLRLWDFGGQEIQHSVHKLFLQDNCVYVLLLNKRQDQQSDGNLIYWLNHIRSFGKNSPVLIVENFIDTVSGIDANSTPEQIAEHGGLRNEIKQHYHSELAPLDYVGISAKKGYNLETLKEKLYKWTKAENNRGMYSPRWLAAKNHIEERITGGTEFGGLSRNNYITKETFDLECEQVEIVDPNAQDTILGVMLRLGIAFYFKKSENRKNWLVLNPEWVTVGIYSLILHPKVKELNGRLLRSDLEEILVNDTSHSFFSKKDYTFSEDELGYLLGLMQDYELCYTPDQNEFFLPTGFVRNYNSQFRNDNPGAVAFFIEYDTLPQAIWFKFLVRLFKRQVVEQYWQEGIEVAVSDAKGLVEFLPLLDKKIKLWVSGKTDNARIELMRLLRYELDFVNEEFSNITVTAKLFTEDEREINYADALSALYQNEPIKAGFVRYDPLPMVQAVDSPETTLVAVMNELMRMSKRMEVMENVPLQIAKQLEKSGVANLIINNNINENINIVKTRFELPRETNEFEGKLNFLIEELKDREIEQKLLKGLLVKIGELRLIPTKEEAVKKGFIEHLKKFAAHLKIGTDFSKSLKEIGTLISVEDINRGIESISDLLK